MYAITRHVTTHTDTIPCGWPILYTNVTMKKGSDVQIPILGVPTRNFRQASNLLSTRVTGTIGLGQWTVMNRPTYTIIGLLITIKTLPKDIYCARPIEVALEAKWTYRLSIPPILLPKHTYTEIIGAKWKSCYPIHGNVPIRHTSLQDVIMQMMVTKLMMQVIGIPCRLYPKNA